jgi:phage major head subunit gpT-like protein
MDAQIYGALNTGIVTGFNERLTDKGQTKDHIAVTVPSTTSQETYPSLVSISDMEEWDGDLKIDSIDQDAFLVKNRKFGKGVEVDVDDVDDFSVTTAINKAMFAVNELADIANQLPDRLVWAQLERGFDTVGYDGQFFFDADHPVRAADGSETTVSNFQGGAGTPWYLVDDRYYKMPIIFQERLAPQMTSATGSSDHNVIMRDKLLWRAKQRCEAAFGAWPLIYASREPLTAANYEAARAAMGGMLGENGRQLDVMPTKLIVGRSNEGAARRLLINETLPQGGTNEWHRSAELHVERRLTL